MSVRQLEPSVFQKVENIEALQLPIEEGIPYTLIHCGSTYQEDQFLLNRNTLQIADFLNSKTIRPATFFNKT